MAFSIPALLINFAVGPEKLPRENCNMFYQFLFLLFYLFKLLSHFPYVTCFFLNRCNFLYLCLGHVRKVSFKENLFFSLIGLAIYPCPYLQLRGLRIYCLALFLFSAQLFPAHHSWKELGTKKKKCSRSEWTVQKVIWWAERPNRVSEDKEIPTACLGFLLELPRYWLKWCQRGAGWRGAASGRCWLDPYCDPSCLIGEVPESRKEVSRLANSLVSTV